MKYLFPILPSAMIVILVKCINNKFKYKIYQHTVDLLIPDSVNVHYVLSEFHGHGFHSLISHGGFIMLLYPSVPL